VRDRAADAGTAAHAMMEAHIRKQQFDPTPFQPDILAKARKGIWGVQGVGRDSQFEITDTEVRAFLRSTNSGAPRMRVSLGVSGRWRLENLKRRLL